MKTLPFSNLVFCETKDKTVLLFFSIDELKTVSHFFCVIDGIFQSY